MVLTAGAEAHMVVLSIALLIASAGVVDHSGIKIPFFAFFAHDNGKRVEKAPLNMRVAMGLAAAMCLFLGFGPGMKMLYSILPYPVVAAEYHAWTMSHVMFYLQLLLFAALAFAIMFRKGIYPPELRATNIDTDVVYRKLLPAAIRGGLRHGNAAFTAAKRVVMGGVWAVVDTIRRTHTPPSLMGEPWAASATAGWAAAILGLFLLMAWF
jgi:multicomponent Na+:H+ antiporter subunit D